MRERIGRQGFLEKLCDNNLAKVSPIGPGAADLEFKTHTQLAKIFVSRIGEKQNITAAVQFVSDAALSRMRRFNIFAKDVCMIFSVFPMHSRLLFSL